MESKQIDALIAEKIFGWVRWEGPTGFKCFGPPGPGGHRDTPEFSTDIAAAWQVVEKMREEGYGYALMDEPAHQCAFSVAEAEKCRAKAPTPSLAICLAALAAVGVEVPNAGK